MVTRLLVLAAMGCATSAITASADAAPADPVAAPRPARAEAGPHGEDIARWIDALSSEAYAERKAATQKLLAAGQPAIASLVRAADSDDLEIPGRCIRILKRLTESPDRAAKQAAIDALRELVRSRHSYVTREATLALVEPPAMDDPRLRLLRGRAFGQVRRVPVQVVRPAPRSLVRELDVEDNGRKVSIRYQTGHEREIRVRITESVNGQKQTQEFKAENTTALGEQSAAAAELYTKYAHDLIRQPVQVVGGNQPVFLAELIAQQPVGIRVGGAARALVRELEVEDQGRKVFIRYRRTGHASEIRVRIAETVNGKEQTQEFKAANTTALREQSETAADLYTKHARDLLRQPVQLVAEKQPAMQWIAVPRPAMRIRVQANENGERSIRVEQNDRQIHITETDGRDIVVRITRVENGERQTAEYPARDLDELNERHPEAAEVYEKYARGLGARVTTGRAVPVPRVPLRPAAAKPVDPPADEAPAVPAAP